MTDATYETLTAEYRTVKTALVGALDDADGAFPGSRRWTVVQPKIKAAEAAVAKWEAEHADYINERKARTGAEADRRAQGGY